MSVRVAVEELAAGDVAVVSRGHGYSPIRVLVVEPWRWGVLVVRTRSGTGWGRTDRRLPVRAGRSAVLVEGPPVGVLTPAQVAMLGLWASGEVSSAKQVARRLGVELKTVHNQLNDAARRLGTSGTTQTVVRALTEGLVELPARVVEAGEAA